MNGCPGDKMDRLAFFEYFKGDPNPTGSPPPVVILNEVKDPSYGD